MTITLQVQVNGSDGHRAMLRRAVELPFVPMPGMEIEGSAWMRKVKTVTVNIDHVPCDVQVYLGYDEEGSVEMYEDFGWTFPEGTVR